MLHALGGACVAWNRIAIVATPFNVRLIQGASP